jgi:hypothetical protein
MEDHVVMTATICTLRQVKEDEMADTSRTHGNKKIGRQH